MKNLLKEILKLRHSQISDDIERYVESDIYWATKRNAPFINRTVRIGEIYQFEFGKNFIPEMSYEHRGLVIGVLKRLLYVLPISSFFIYLIMLAEKIKVTGVLNMDMLYNRAVAGIEIILKHRYKMKVSDAKSAIAMSPLKELFKQNAEMAAHTSNETWAREIYEFWKRNLNK